MILIGDIGIYICCRLGEMTNTGAAKKISSLGLDLAGGVSITYQVKDENPSESEMKDTNL